MRLPARRRLTRTAPAALVLAMAAAAWPVVGQQPVEFEVQSAAPLARRAVVRVSLPFARGVLPSAGAVVLDVDPPGTPPWPARPLLCWPDGSIAVLQAHVRLELPARGVLHAVARPVDRAPGLPGPPPPDSSGPALVPVWTEVEDPWGRTYVARWPTATPVDDLSSRMVRVYRIRAVHERDGVAFLGLTGFWVSVPAERRVELTLVLDNAAAVDATGPVLGPVRLRRFSFACGARDTVIRPRFARANALRAGPAPTADGQRLDLLGPSDQIYLGDRTGKAFRVDLDLRGRGLDPGGPLRPLPALAAVRRSRAFGAHGGPGPAGADAAATRPPRQHGEGGTGPFGGHGDPPDAAAQGTPRNAASALHNVLRWRSTALLARAEAAVLQQTLRPTPGATPRSPARTAPLRAGLTQRAVRRPHGFTALDYEHFSVDLLYDYYWLTGDPLARAELRRAGSGLLAVLEGAAFPTCRGEGWCLQAAVLIARATGDRELLRGVRRRYVERIAPSIAAAPAGTVLPQPGHPRAFGPLERFDSPWQMAALVHGLHALWRETEEPGCLPAVERSADIMVGSGWLDGVGPKALVSAADPSRYTLPVGYGSLEGTALLQAGGMVLAAEMVADRSTRRRLWRRADRIVGAVEDPHAGAHRWLQLYFDRAEAR